MYNVKYMCKRAQNYMFSQCGAIHTYKHTHLGGIQWSKQQIGKVLSSKFGLW